METLIEMRSWVLTSEGHHIRGNLSKKPMKTIWPKHNFNTNLVSTFSISAIKQILWKHKLRRKRYSKYIRAKAGESGGFVSVKCFLINRQKRLLETKASTCHQCTATHCICWLFAVLYTYNLACVWTTFTCS